MKIKNVLGCFALAAMLLGGANFAHAYYHGNNNGMVDLTVEQQAQYDDMLNAYHGKVRPLHDKLRLKYMELEAYQNNVNVKPADISKLIKEIASIEDEISLQRADFANNVQDKLGIDIQSRRHHNYGQGGNCGSGYGCNRDGASNHNGHGNNHNGNHRGGCNRGY